MATINTGNFAAIQLCTSWLLVAQLLLLSTLSLTNPASLESVKFRISLQITLPPPMNLIPVSYSLATNAIKITIMDMNNSDEEDSPFSLDEDFPTVDEAVLYQTVHRETSPSPLPDTPQGDFDDTLTVDVDDSVVDER